MGTVEKLPHPSNKTNPNPIPIPRLLFQTFPQHPQNALSTCRSTTLLSTTERLDLAVARSSFSSSALKFFTLAKTKNKTQLTHQTQQVYQCNTICHLPKPRRVPWWPWPKKCHQ